MFLTPSWLLLVWTGLAATLAIAAIFAPLFGSRGPRGSVYFFRPRAFPDFLLLALLGILVYPLVYGFIFDSIHVASAFSGAVTGALHGVALVAISAIRRRRPEMPGITLLLYVAYGAVLGFFYVTP